MKRFTVSLPDDLYSALRLQGEQATPPASLQQMIRYAVDSLVASPSASRTAAADEPPPDTDSALLTPAPEPVDLLVFNVGEVEYGIAIEMVETVAAGLAVHPIPTTSATLTGVAVFRDALTEVHDGGMVLQGSPIPDRDTGSMLAVPGANSRVLMTVTSVDGLTPADAGQWSARPASAPSWVSALAWTNERVVTVIDPRSFNLQ